MKILCRKSLSALLKKVPAETFLGLRASFPMLVPTSVRYQIQRRILGVVRHRGVPEDVDTFTLTDNPGIRLVNADSFVVERLYWYGEKYGYEPEVLRWWRRYCGRSASILELGANIGYFTIQGAKAAGASRYVAVEPHPNCAAVCRENIRINELTNVEVVEAAAVPQGGAHSVSLITPGRRSRDHYQAPCTGYVGKNEMHREEPDSTEWGSVIVAAENLTDLLVGVDLMKLDVEGQEFSLLSSVADQLATTRPTMFVELLDDTPNLRALIVQLCSTTGYKCFVPTTTRLVALSVSEIPHVSLIGEYGTRDLIMTCDVVAEWLG